MAVDPHLTTPMPGQAIQNDLLPQDATLPPDEPHTIFHRHGKRIADKTIKIDGEPVAVIAFIDQRFGMVRHIKPYRYYNRKTCGAFNKQADAIPCQNDAKTCTIHCGAWLRRTARACGAQPQPGRQRCHRHGGTALQGAANPRFIDGRTSKYAKAIPQKLKGDFQEFLHGDYLSMREEVAVLRLQVMQALERTDGESDQAWQSLSKAYDDLIKATQKGEGIEQALMAIGNLIKNGAGAREAAQDAREIIGDLADVVSKESRIISEREHSLSPVQAIAFVASMVNAVKRIFGDDGEGMKRFSDELQMILEYEKTGGGSGITRRRVSSRP